jgi:sporulation protein YabP
MIQEKPIAPKPKPHNLILENRNKLSLSGVLDVENFNDQCISAVTDLGVIIIKGHSLHIERLNLESSELMITGGVYLIEYEDRAIKKKGWRIF